MIVSKAQFEFAKKTKIVENIYQTSFIDRLSCMTLSNGITLLQKWCKLN